MSYMDNNGKFNHGKWLRDQLLTEAPMDKRFQKEWEKSTKALLNHMKHEYDELTRTGDHMRMKNAYKWLRGAMKDVDKVSGYAAQMAKFFGMQEGKLNETFTPGDMWSEDFDYIGMLKYGAQVQDVDPDADMMEVDEIVSKLNLLFDSFEDVNYHRESQDLGNAIEYLEDDPRVEDIEKANDFLALFRKKCMSTLDVMKVKWTPKG